MLTLQKSVFVLIILLLVTGSAHSQPYAGDLETDGALGFYLDMASFRYDDNSIQQDFYYEIPYEQLTFVDDSKFPDQFVIARINTNFSIREVKTGQFISEDSWDSPVGLQKGTLETLKPAFRLMFSEVIPEGEYELYIKLTDLQSDRSGSALVPFNTRHYVSGELAISDIIMATEIKADSLETMFLKNGYTIKPNPARYFDLQNPLMYYYYEIYGLDMSKDTNQFQITYTLMSADDDTVKSYRPKVIESPGSSAVIVDAKNLVTMKTGDYQLVIEVTDPNTGNSVTKIKSFKMDRSLAEQKVQVELKPMSDPEAKDFLDKVEYFITAGERSEFENLDPVGRSRFVQNFWRERDPIPSTPENEYKTEIEERISYANKQFATLRVTKSMKPGFKTDQGRIYVKYGDPDDTSQGMMPETEIPFIIWRYYNLTNISYFLFMDEKSLGNYKLMMTDDQSEVSDPTFFKNYSDDWDYIQDLIAQ